MIDIVLSENGDSPILKDFSAREWPGADREHFGDQVLDFTKRKLSLAARENGNIVGCISLILDMGVLHLESIIVAETHRGHGVGARLVASAEENGKSLGAHKIWLETGSDWKAKDFYTKLGYQIRAELHNYYANRDYIMMDKDL